MEKLKLEKKIFMGLGAISSVCGIFLAYSENWVAGISGAIVGLFLVYDNYKKLKALKEQ